MNLHNVPGLSFALIEGTQITLFVLGTKNAHSQEPITTTTVFEGASLSKPVIAYASLKLCKEGLLDLDRPLGTSTVTLRRILSHTGGFPAGHLKPGEALKLNPQPGFSYSGEGFRYLGQIIEQVTNTPLAVYLQEQVFIPLKMEHSSLVWEERYEILAASPHNQRGDPLEKWKPHQATASCSLHTTASDFAKFMIAAEQFPEMAEVQTQIEGAISWGLGWGIETDSRGREGLWHSGDNGGFQCFAFQNSERGFVVMTNSPNGMTLYRELLDHWIGGEHPLLDWEEFDSRAKEEFPAIWWGDYARE